MKLPFSFALLAVLNGFTDFSQTKAQIFMPNVKLYENDYLATVQKKRDSKGFHIEVRPWHDYYKPKSKTYRIPMHVKTDTYPLEYLPKLWESMNWVRDHFLNHTHIELYFMDQSDINKKRYPKGWIAPFYEPKYKGCNSHLGSVNNYYDFANNGRGQDMDVGWCYNYPGKILHETMHALGFLHEHNRPDRGRFIQVRNTKNYANCGVIVANNDDGSKLWPFGVPYGIAFENEG